jgi:glyoxylase-like metal-dependent hydrolase (beta-lactamase superfamily II)
MAVMSPLYPRGPVDVRNRLKPLPVDGSVPLLDEWRWLHTPGHTAGHISLFRESDRTLIVGDAFCTTKPESFLAVASQKPELHGPPAYYTSDWENARRSVELLTTLQPRIAVPGHGLPIAGPDVAKDLSELARRFVEIAVPEHGKYVEHPQPS